MARRILWAMFAKGVVDHPGLFFIISTVTVLTGGAMFLMWVGEQITARGVGNGSSLIIFAGIIANVPFVDVLNTILDEELPLTPPEWLEWGNPIKDADAFANIRAYSPYDNVGAHAYPPILALGGLTDPRVTYWEPAKWAAKLRATMSGGGPVLLRTAMGAGHAGAPGRFDRLDDVARVYAFAIAVAEGRPFGA